MEKISVVVPCYNEENTIPLFYSEIDKISKKMKKLNFEFLFINDGSSDKTLDVCKELAKKDKRVKYISFSRNFGKEAAMYAGLKKNSGDLVALMDADLQDPPKLLIEMYKNIIKNNYDIVIARRKNRKGEPVIRSFFSEVFYKLIAASFLRFLKDYLRLKK